VAACGGSRTAADTLIERINQAIKPSAAQRGVIDELHGALIRAIDRIESVCRRSTGDGGRSTQGNPGSHLGDA
jgi:hypothetical protein